MTKAAEDWDWEFYEQEHGKEAAGEFRKPVDAVDGLVRRKGWGVQYNLNKYYTRFKLGNKVAFSVEWGGTHAWKIGLKLREGVGDAFKGEQWEFQTCDWTVHEATFRPLHPEAADIADLGPLFVEAYRIVSGARFGEAFGGWPSRRYVRRCGQDGAPAIELIDGDQLLDGLKELSLETRKTAQYMPDDTLPLAPYSSRIVRPW